MKKHTHAPIRKSVLLIAVVSILAVICYVFYFDASDFQAKASVRVRSAASIDPLSQGKLAKQFSITPDKLTDDEYVAAAIAWDREMQAVFREEPDPLPKTDLFAGYDAMMDEIEHDLKVIGPNQPALREAILDLAEQADEDFP